MHGLDSGLKKPERKKMAKKRYVHLQRWLTERAESCCCSKRAGKFCRQLSLLLTAYVQRRHTVLANWQIGNYRSTSKSCFIKLKKKLVTMFQNGKWKSTLRHMYIGSYLSKDIKKLLISSKSSKSPLNNYTRGNGAPRGLSTASYVV